MPGSGRWHNFFLLRKLKKQGWSGEFLNPNNCLVVPKEYQLKIPFQSSWERGKQTAPLGFVPLCCTSGNISKVTWRWKGSKGVPALWPSHHNSPEQTLLMTGAEWKHEGRGNPVSPGAEGTGQSHDDSPADGLSTETKAHLMSCALHASQREEAAR